MCRTCRWSSRTAGVPDASKQSSVVSPWNFKPDASTRDEVTALADFYRGLSVTDRASMVPKNQKPKKYRPGYPFIADKYKLVSVAQKRVSAAAVAPPDMVVLQARLPKVEHLNNLAECSEEELLRSVSVDEAQNRLTLDKRLMYPGQQPLTADKLLPRNKPLVCKKLSRCKACQHVMTKMDFAARKCSSELLTLHNNVGESFQNSGILNFAGKTSTLEKLSVEANQQSTYKCFEFRLNFD